MNKYLIFCLLLVSSCQVQKRIRQEDFLWEICNDSVFHNDFISIEGSNIWFNQIRAKKSYLIDKKTGVSIDSIDIKPYEGLYGTYNRQEKKNRKIVVTIPTLEKSKYNISLLIKSSRKVHGSDKRYLEIENKALKYVFRYSLKRDLITNIQDIIAIDSTSVLLRFHNEKKGCYSIGLIDLDSLMRRKE